MDTYGKESTDMLDVLFSATKNDKQSRVVEIDNLNRPKPSTGDRSVVTVERKATADKKPISVKLVQLNE